MKYDFLRIEDLKFRDYLLNGYILKMDGGGHNFIEAIKREGCDTFELRKNVGSNNGEHLPRATAELKAAIESLKADGYVVMETAADMSGCCQYHATIYYLPSRDFILNF